ncbi:terminase small subunit [Parendozoicomonas haliclonae]|uniref:Terminase small subunit n=1 Tax=Parendozoicomonas haliclonae TaxID=1960125 RepID=A0A1X7AJ47_9GAMM|nr:terminase small subunit [Parendozoicomonas haliclonae]SMA45526.1 Terminase small subunit [Parendozoicomonas haliclonae]
MQPKHQRFVDEYIIDQNATRAAIAAGYSERTATSQGSRLLTKVKVQQAIEERQNQISQSLQITASDKRERLWAIATFNTETIEDPHGEMRMRDPRAATSAIAELNKMDGAYVQAGSEQTQVTFIQNFGDDWHETPLLVSEQDM